MSSGMGGPATSCPFLQGGQVSNLGGDPRAQAFDPFGDTYLQDPPGSLAWSRNEQPVFFNEDLGYWVVTRYDDVKAVFRDNITFSPSIALEKITPNSDEANAVLESYGYAMSRTLVNEDEPAHMPRRRALMEPFLPAQLGHHEEMVRRLTREFVDRIIDNGRADLVDEMLYEVPLTVALHFLGVPEEDMASLRKFSVAHTVNTWGRPKPEQQVAVAEAVGQFWQYSGGVLEKLRQDPSGEGWMPYGIRQNEVMPDVVTDSYLHSIMMAGIVAAHETTANAAANAIKLLLENPDSWRDLCEDPSLIPNAIEECLRHSGSIVAWRRQATVATEIGGVPIPAGARLLIANASANHDERQFDDPDVLDIRRQNAGEHLTFGFGSHQCMGKNLARMELQIILEELTTRLPHLKLVEGQEFTYLPNASFRGPEHLWVEWDPAGNPERRRPAILDRRQPLRIGEPSSKLISHRLTVTERELIADDIVRLRLEVPSGRSVPAWTPGSHIDLDCDGLSRQYSLCGDPQDRSGIEIAVLREPASRGGSRFVHDVIAVGQDIRIRGPRNHFRFDPDARHHIFIAGGIGITPIKTLATHARRTGASYEIHYAGRTGASMAFLEDLIEEHGSSLQVHRADEQNRMDLSAMLADPRRDTRVYACGPQRMLDGIAAAMVRWPADALRSEHFASSGAGVLNPENEHEFEVVLRDSGLTLTVPKDRTLLQVLQGANIDVQSDCKEGLCGSCEVGVLAGKIDHRDVVLNAEDRKANRSMMTCCSRAAGRKIEVAL